MGPSRGGRALSCTARGCDLGPGDVQEGTVRVCPGRVHPYPDLGFRLGHVLGTSRTGLRPPASDQSYTITRPSRQSQSPKQLVNLYRYDRGEVVHRAEVISDVYMIEARRSRSRGQVYGYPRPRRSRGRGYPDLDLGLPVSVSARLDLGPRPLASGLSLILD